MKPSLRVNNIFQALHSHKSRRKKKKPAAFPFGGSHFLLGFLHLQRRAGTAGGGSEEEINAVYPGNCSCYYKWPREPTRSGCVCPKLCRWSAHYVEPLQSPIPWLLASTPPSLSRAAEPRGKGGARHWSQGSLSAAGRRGRGGGLQREAQTLSTRHPHPFREVEGASLEDSCICKTVRSLLKQGNSVSF